MERGLKPRRAQRRGMLAPVLRGLRLRCPACGEWSGVLMFAQGFYGGLGLVGLFALVLARAPLSWTLAWIVATAAALPVLTYRNFKGAWIGTMWAARPW